MSKIYNAITILLMALSCFLNAQSPGISKRQNEIDNEIKKLSSQKKTILNEIYKLELLYEKENIKLQNIQHELRIQERKIDQLNQEKKNLIIDIQESKKRLKKVLRIMYKSNSQPAILFFIRISSFNHLYMHYMYFVKIFDYKSSQISHLKQQITKVASIEKQLYEELEALKGIKLESENTLKKIQKNKAEQLQLMEKVNNDYSYFSQMLEELKSQSAELDKVLSEQPHFNRIENVKNNLLKGKMPRPLKGRLLNRFGKMKSSKFNTYVFNNGIKIRPDQNDKIISVFPGVVVFSNYFKGYGNLLIVRHSKDLYTLYGHCKEFMKETGDWVQQGEIIATAGDTGSTMGKVLYFEVRVGVKSEDPLQWFLR